MADVVIDISAKMVEAVLKEYEADNPGRSASGMSSDEFADRMMKKIVANMKIVGEPGHA